MTNEEYGKRMNRIGYVWGMKLGVVLGAAGALIFMFGLYLVVS